MASVTLKKLKSVAQEINEQVNPDPNLTIEGAKKQELKDQVVAVCEQVIIPEEDDLSDDSKAILDQIGCNPWEESEEETGEENATEQETEENSEETAEAGEEKGEETGKGKSKEKSGKTQLNTNTPKGNTTGKSATQLVKELVEEGGHTRKEIQDKLVEMGYKSSTPSTILSDAMSEKYQKFDKLVVKDENGKLSFAE